MMQLEACLKCKFLVSVSYWNNSRWVRIQYLDGDFDYCHRPCFQQVGEAELAGKVREVIWH